MKRVLTDLRTRFSTAGELVRSIWNGPYWWLVPALCILLPGSIVFVFLQAVPIVAPFVYTVF
jgi:hypothetical protein